MNEKNLLQFLLIRGKKYVLILHILQLMLTKCKKYSIHFYKHRTNEQIYYTNKVLNLFPWLHFK